MGVSLVLWPGDHLILLLWMPRKSVRVGPPNANNNSVIDSLSSSLATNVAGPKNYPPRLSQCRIVDYFSHWSNTVQAGTLDVVG